MPDNLEKNLPVSASPCRRVTFYGGSFDPVHNAHLAIAKALIKLFALDEFVFIPAHHAPHKKDRKPISAFHRYAMLSLATHKELKIKVSTIELEAPAKPFTVETQMKLKTELGKDAQIFFVIGADSWAEIETWRQWKKVLTNTNIIVVTRPDYEITFSHITDEIKARVVDLRKGTNAKAQKRKGAKKENYPQINADEGGLKNELRIGNCELRGKENSSLIYITDAVYLDISATEIRQKIFERRGDWRKDVPSVVAKYIEKYELYSKKSED